VTLDRVCVVGAGSIGSLCAGHLARNASVTVLTRRPEQAAALNEHGLRVSGKSDFVAAVGATTDPDELPDLDLCIVATKATQMAAALDGFRGRFPDATFMTIQNGIGAERVVADHGSWPIISSVTFMSGTRHDDRHIEYELDTATWMGPYRGTATPMASVEAVGDLFVKSGLKAEVLPDLLPAQWSKLIFNCAVNCVAALTDLPHVALFARTERFTDLGHVVAALIDEGARVAAAASVTLFEDPWQMNVQAVSTGQTAAEDYAHVPSMLADVRAGSRTEVDFIMGSLVAEAQRLGVEVPLSTAVYRLVKARDRSHDEGGPPLLGGGAR
jgi:2-dehydropantoate 2-reductase